VRRIQVVDSDLEVERYMNAVRVLFRGDDKAWVVFPVCEPRNAKHAGRVGRRRVSPELSRHGTKQGFGVILCKAFDPPDHLELVP
jgi:hypothetical protein